MSICKYKRDSEIEQYTPECCVEGGLPLTSVHETDMTEWTYCPYCGDQILCYTDGKVERS